ncbi:MAG: nuclear transport factor 2 family protein [Oscillospiraceae bacterium]|jgi:hypothetical protein|nr:nuclear transport factor 2 family protein [Oscillospiraceae bacterium]
MGQIRESRTTDGVKATVDDYIQGTYTADAALLKSVFHEKAALSGYMSAEILIASPEAFIADVTSKPSMKSSGTQYETEVTDIEITGKIATATVTETGFFGEVSFRDYFHLIHDKEWKIISKLFTTL